MEVHAVDIKSHPRCRGQALVEMVAGLLVVLLLLTGLLQIARLARAHTEAMLIARERADRAAMALEQGGQLRVPRYILDWEPGVRDVRYTQHDRARTDSGHQIRMSVVRHGLPDRLATYTDNGLLADVDRSLQITDAFQFVYGAQRSRSVPVYPILRNLVIRQESLSMEHQVWMPWARGLDE
jgi:hypothetical protein